MDRISSQLHAEMADMESIRRYISGATFDPRPQDPSAAPGLRSRRAGRKQPGREWPISTNFLAGGQTVPPREGDEIVVAA